MAEELKAPVAIRITRPYATEDEFLEHEFDTLTRTSVVLLGAQPRPQGVVLRFEIVLTGGESILRGEGRVVGHKERAYGGEPGLTLRFTRLDARSKLLLDRASALRDARVKAGASLMAMPAVVVPRPAPSEPASSGILDRGSEAPPARASAPPPPPRPSTPPPPPPRVTPVPFAPSAPLPPVARAFPPPLPASVARKSPVPPPPLPEPPISSTMLDDVDVLLASEPPAPPQMEAPRRPSRPPRPAARPLAPPLPGPAAEAREVTPPPLPAAPRVPPFAPPQTRISPADATPSSGAQREPLLARLRARASALPESRVSEILATGAARR